MKPDDCRRYLEGALAEQDVKWNHVSEQLGHSHAYIQQYLKKGTPRYLREQDIQLLVRLYNLDGSRLREPPKEPRPLRPKLKGASSDAPQVDPEDLRNFLNAAENKRFLSLWISLGEDTQIVALDMLEALGRLGRVLRAKAG
jgi:hypothetical protein